MATNRMSAIANIVYTMLKEGNKDEIAAVSSFVINNPDSNYEAVTDPKRIDELATSKFRTHEQESQYKKVLSIVSAILRGTINSTQVDVLVDKDKLKDMKESGLLNNFKRKGTAGGYVLFVEDNGNQD